MENQNLPSLRLDRTNGQHANQDIPVLVQKMHELINVDEPLPIVPLSRYLASVCLVGIERAPNLSAKRNWIETMNRILRTGKEISEQGDVKTDAKRMKILDTLFKAAEAYDNANEGESGSAGADPGSRP